MPLTGLRHLPTQWLLKLGALNAARSLCLANSGSATFVRYAQLLRSALPVNDRQGAGATLLRFALWRAWTLLRRRDGRTDHLDLNALANALSRGAKDVLLVVIKARASHDTTKTRATELASLCDPIRLLKLWRSSSWLSGNLQEQIGHYRYRYAPGASLAPDPRPDALAQCSEPIEIALRSIYQTPTREGYEDWERIAATLRDKHAYELFGFKIPCSRAPLSEKPQLSAADLTAWNTQHGRSLLSHVRDGTLIHFDLAETGFSSQPERLPASRLKGLCWHVSTAVGPHKDGRLTSLFDAAVISLWTRACAGFFASR